MGGIRDLRQIEIGVQAVDCDTAAVPTERVVGSCGMKRLVNRVFPTQPTGLMSSHIINRYYDPWVMAELPMAPGDEGLTFQQFVYYLAMGAVGGVTGVGVGADKTWEFAPDLAAGDAPDIFTIRYGDDAGSWESTCCFARQLVISASSQSPWQIDADIIGRDMQVEALVGIVYPTPLYTILGQMTSFYVDDTCAFAGVPTVVAGSLIDWSVTVPGFHPKFFQDGILTYTQPGLASRHLTLEATVEWDAVFAAAEHANWYTNTPRYMRIQAVGPLIGAGPPTYLATIDLVVEYESFETLEERDGNDIIKFVARTVYDVACVAVPEWRITVVNEDAALP